MTTQPPRIWISNSSSCHQHPPSCRRVGRGQQVSGWVARLNAGVISSLAPAGDTGAAAPSPALQQVRGGGGAIHGRLGCVILIIVILVTVSLLTEPRPVPMLSQQRHLWIEIFNNGAGLLGGARGGPETPRFIWKYSQIFDCLDVPCPSADDDGNWNKFWVSVNSPFNMHGWLLPAAVPLSIERLWHNSGSGGGQCCITSYILGAFIRFMFLAGTIISKSCPPFKLKSFLQNIFSGFKADLQ